MLAGRLLRELFGLEEEELRAQETMVPEEEAP